MALPKDGVGEVEEAKGGGGEKVEEEKELEKKR